MTTPYGSASELLTDRIRWSAALLGLVVDRGREEGWLAGGRVEIADPDVIEAHLSSRLAATEDLTVSPLDWMVLRLELEDELLTTELGKTNFKTDGES